MALMTVIEQLKQELKSKNEEIRKIEEVIGLLSSGGKIRVSPMKGRKMSPEAIERIRAAQKKRWAEKRKALKKG